MALETTSIAAVVPDLLHLQKWNDMHGDTADPFWADDDSLYHFTCDGRGFGHEPRNICFNKLSGPDLPRLRGALVNSLDEYGKSNEAGPDGATWKVTGQECIDGVFYGFVVRNIYGHLSGDPLMRQISFDASLIKSHDRGLTWSRSARENCASPMWPGRRFGGPGFIHYGRNGGQEARDGADTYVYAISNNGFWNGGDELILARIPRSALARLHAADWAYHTGGDGLADSAWASDISRAAPILRLPGRLGWTSPVFIPALNRYLLVSWYVTPTLLKWFEPHRVTYDFYEAPHPWGPWTFVSSFDDRFLSQGHMYGPNLCAKHQERRGEDVKVDLYTSGCPFEDAPGGLYKNWRIPLIVKTKPEPQATVVNDDDPRIRYRGSWQAAARRGCHDFRDDAHLTTTPGDEAELEFTGTGVALLSERAADMGPVEVFIDGERREVVDLRVEDFPRLAQVRVFSARGLPPGRHRIRVVNASAACALVDAFLLWDGESEG